MSKCIGGVLSEWCWKLGDGHWTLPSVKNIDIPCVLHTFAHYGFRKSRGGPNLFSMQIRTARTDLSNLLNEIVLKSPRAVRTCVFTKVCRDNYFYMFLCKSARHTPI